MMTRRLLALLLALVLLAGCAPEPTRTIDCWQSAVDQGWVQP